MGMVPFQALTDKLPYATKTTEHAIIVALLESEIPAEIESLLIPVPDLKLLLAKCWAITPIERPSAAYCLRILNSVSPSSQASIHVGKITVQENPKQPSLRETDSSVSPTNIGSGARPQNNADRGSRRNAERREEEYENAEPSGSSKDKLWSEVFQERIPSLKALQAAKGSREDTSRAIGPSSNSVPSQLNARVPQQRQARTVIRSKAWPVVGSAPTQPKPHEPAQTPHQTQLGTPSPYGYDTYSRLSFGHPPPAYPPFQPPIMQYGAFQPPGGPFPGYPPLPPPPAPLPTGPWPPYDQTILGQYPAPPQPFPQTRATYFSPGLQRHPHATTSLRGLETPSAVSEREMKMTKELHQKEWDAFRAEREAERRERERRKHQKRYVDIEVESQHPKSCSNNSQYRNPEDEDRETEYESGSQEDEDEEVERLRAVRMASFLAERPPPASFPTRSWPPDDQTIFGQYPAPNVWSTGANRSPRGQRPHLSYT
ncbi:hypothetical protein FRC05_001409 [Tulasnella sp. 425]|nr:hypothetical protein FRC05_001409 [Tulasnella sp. 425]